jgi:hypothetical protein
MELEIKLQLRSAEHVKVLKVVKLMKKARTGSVNINHEVNLWLRLEPVTALRTPRLISLKGSSVSYAQVLPHVDPKSGQSSSDCVTCEVSPCAGRRVTSPIAAVDRNRSSRLTQPTHLE